MKKFFREIFRKIKNLDKTIDSYKTKSNRISMPSKAYLNWGINLALEGKIDDAIEKFEMSSTMHATDPESYMNWGIALAKLHRFEEAVEKFDEALKIDRTYSSAYSLKGAALVELNQIEEAIECYNYAVKYAPFDPEIYVNWGVALARLGQKAKAETQFKKALGLSLHNVNASFLLGVVLYEQNKLKEAYEAFKYTIGLQPTHTMAFYYLSLSCTKLENYEEALGAAKVAVQLMPFRIDLMVNLAECYYDVKDLKATIKTYRSIEVIAPDAFPLLISAGIFWQKVKKYKKSLKYLEKAIEKPEADYLTKYYLGISYAGENRITEAKTVFEELLEKNPEFSDGVVKLAILYKTNQEYKKSIEVLERLFAKSVKHHEYYELLADCYKHDGNMEKAMEYYRKTIEYYPENANAHAALANILFSHVKDTKAALRFIRVANKLKKEDARINTLYALILADEGLIEEGLIKIEKALSIDENDVEIYLRKAFILKKAHRTDEYHSLLDFMKEKFPEKVEYIDEMVKNY